MSVPTTELDKTEHRRFESAQFELRLRAELYQTYLRLFSQGCILLLAVTGALFKFVLDDLQHRLLYGSIGLLSCVCLYSIIAFGVWSLKKRTMKDFIRLADETGTVPIEINELSIALVIACIANTVIMIAWVYVLIVIN